MKLPRTTGYRVGVGDIAIVIKGRKVPSGTYGMVVAFGRPRMYNFGVTYQTSALVHAPDDERIWVNAENLEKLELNNWKRTVLTVRAGQSRAEFIEKCKYQIDEVTYLDFCVMVSAELNGWDFKRVANFYRQNYTAVEKAFIMEMNIESHKAFNLKQEDPETIRCTGACTHSVLYHVANMPNTSGEYDLACTKMDCPCMKYVPEKKASKDVVA